MKKKSLAENNEEFDRRFDQGEDIHQLIDLSKTEITKPGKKVVLPWMSASLWLRKLIKYGKPSVSIEGP